MPKQSPLPMVHAFLVCRRITHNVVSGEYTLIAPQLGFVLPRFPAAVRVSIYGQLSEVRGEYYPELRLWGGPGGDILWENRAPAPMTSPNDDPLRQHRFVFRNLAIPFPTPGRYDLLLMAHKTEIARYPLSIEKLPTGKK
jgi:hypothetical protein